MYHSKPEKSEIIECEICKKKFKAFKIHKRKFCSKKCMGISQGINIKNNGNINLIKFTKGHTPHNKGKTKENYEPLMRTSNAIKFKSEFGDYREKVSKGNKLKKKSEEHIKKLIETHWSKNLNVRDIAIKKISEKAKNRWENLDYRKKQIELLTNKRPTSYEKKISELCIENSLPFIYTGNGTFLIGYKNPDFVNKEDKIAIEVYHKYFKERDFGSCENYEKKRSEYFTKYGYKTIFIREEEIMDKNWEEICLNKIKGE